MKKQAIFQLFFAFLALGSYQISYAQISIGARAGILINNLDIDPLEDGEPKPESKIGFQVAVPVEIAIGDIFAVQPEIMFGSHGAKQKGSDTSTEGGFTSVSEFESDVQINALEIPVLAKARFGPESIKFNVFAGPSFGFGISGEGKVKSSVKVTDPTGAVIFDESADETLDAKFVKNDYDSADVDENEIAISKTNLNLHMGAGVSIMLGKASLFLDARYILGLSDLSPEEDGTSKEDEVTVKSNRIGISVGVLFPLN